MHRIPFIISLLTMIGGVIIAIAFGANEGYFKRTIKEGLMKNPVIMINASAEDREKSVEAESGKIWRYYQRYHFHSTGIGAMSMGVLLFLMQFIRSGLLRTFSMYLTSIGGFLYPFVWLFAAIYAPHIGREYAKEQFAFFGYMGGLFLVGLILAAIAIFVAPKNKLLKNS